MIPDLDVTSLAIDVGGLVQRFALPTSEIAHHNFPYAAIDR